MKTIYIQYHIFLVSSQVRPVTSKYTIYAVSSFFVNSRCDPGFPRNKAERRPCQASAHQHGCGQILVLDHLETGGDHIDDGADDEHEKTHKPAAKPDIGLDAGQRPASSHCNADAQSQRNG